MRSVSEDLLLCYDAGEFGPTCGCVGKITWRRLDYQLHLTTQRDFDRWANALVVVVLAMPTLSTITSAVKFLEELEQ